MIFKDRRPAGTGIGSGFTGGDHFVVLLMPLLPLMALGGAYVISAPREARPFLIAGEIVGLVAVLWRRGRRIRLLLALTALVCFATGVVLTRVAPTS